MCTYILASNVISFYFKCLKVFFCQHLITEFNIHHILVIDKITNTDALTLNVSRKGSVHITSVFKADIITGYSSD